MTHEELQSLAALDAIGAATPEEAQELRAHLGTCDECSRVRDEYAEAATLLARGLDPVSPPAELRRRIVTSLPSAAAETDRNENVDENSNAEAVAEAISDPVSIDSRNSNRWWLAAAAMLFLALWGWRELGIRAAHERTISQQAEIASLRDDNQRLTQREAKLAAELQAMGSADTKTIALAGQQMSPAASAKVFLDPSARRAMVFFYNLPVNANDKSYQLWIIRADQPKPQSAGTFDMAQNGRASIAIENLPVATEIKALAVTLESRGGVEQPTSSNFFLMGQS